jgi:hypothetical protein
MKKYLLLFTALAFVSCGYQSISLTSDKSDVESVLNNIQYIQDTSTDLCFAQLRSVGADGYATISITNVPCTEKVKAKL